GLMALGGSNSFTGGVLVNDGTLQIDNDFALGTVAGNTVVNSNAVLLLNDAHVTNEVLVLDSTNAGGALQDNATADWIGPITLNKDVVIEASSLFQLGGAISGPGGFTKISTSTLRFIGTNMNAYSGATIVNAGTLELARITANASILGPLIIGDGIGGAN